MSTLLAHAKALRALGDAYAKVAEEMLEHRGPDDSAARVINGMCRAHRFAADALEAQARADASGPSFEDRPQPQKGRRT
jgi:hypothetical protein